MIDASNVSNLLSTDEEKDVKTLPLKEYLLSYELVNCDEPLIVPATALPLIILLLSDALNATTSPIPKTEPVNEPVIAPLESTEILRRLVKDITEPVGIVNPPLTTATELTTNEPVIVWFPLNEFEPVVANDDVFILELPLKLYRVSNEDVN